MDINPHSPIPKHRQLREILLRLIAANPQPDTPIPSERELSRRFALSRMTVRQAVDQLVADGRLYRVHGRGTFVSQQSQQKTPPHFRLASYAEEMTRRGMVPASRPLVFERIKATRALARKLKIQPGDAVVRLNRLRYADSIPMAVDRTLLPENRVPDILTLGSPKSLYQVLAERYGLTLSCGEQMIEAGTPDSEEAALLQIPVTGVVLQMTRRSYSDDLLVEHNSSVYRADRYRLRVPLENR